MTASIENANLLYRNGEYLAAMEMCRELIGDQSLGRDIWLLSAKCIMVNVPDPNCTEELKEVADSLIRAINETKSVEEAFDVWMDFLPAFSIWEKRITAQALAKFEADPTKENYDNYSRIFIPIFSASMAITLPAKNQSILPQLAAAEGLSIKDAVEKYETGRPYEKAFTEAVQDDMEFEAASNVVARAMRVFEQNRNVTRETYQSVQQPVATAVFLSTFVYRPTQDKDREGIPKDVRFKRLEAYTTWIRFLLEEKFIVDGVPYGMYTPNNNNEIDELKKAYAKMTLLDPSFDPPALPVIGSPAQKKSGCYVATAVYGSYDCPQVWTLRRYRDNTLAKTPCGRAFIKAYYAVSPTVVKWFGNTKWFNRMWKRPLDRIVAKLQAKGFESTPYNDNN